MITSVSKAAVKLLAGPSKTNKDPSTQASQKSFKNSDPSTQLKGVESRKIEGAQQDEALLNAAVKYEAEQLLKVGDQWGTDDYSARLSAFADSLSKNDEIYGKKLMGEVFSLDSEAMESWLDPKLINESVEKGDISSDQRAQIAEYFAAAYNEGHPALAPKKVEGGWRKRDAIESPIDEHLFNRKGLFDDEYSSGEHANRVQKVKNFLSFVESSSGPEAARFKQSYSQHLVDHYTLGLPRYAVVKDASIAQGHRSNAAGIAVHLMTNSKNPESTVEFLSQYRPKQRKYIFKQIEKADFWLSSRHLQRNWGYQPKSAPLPDPLSKVMSTVAKSDSPQAKQLAVELSDQTLEKEKFWLKPRVYDHKKGWVANPVYHERVHAMGEMVAKHAQPILDKWTNHDEISVGNNSGYTERQYHLDTGKLGNLFKVTLLNPVLQDKEELKKQVINYSNDLKDQINTAKETGYSKSVNRLAMLCAGMDEAVSQGYKKLQDERAQKAELVGFAVEFALSAVPASSKLSENIKDSLKTLPKTKINETIQGLGKFAVDKTSHQFTQEAKHQLSELVGPDQAHLIAQGSYRDSLRKSFLSGFNQDNRMELVKLNSRSILNELEDMRN